MSESSIGRGNFGVNHQFKTLQKEQEPSAVGRELLAPGRGLQTVKFEKLMASSSTFNNTKKEKLSFPSLLLEIKKTVANYFEDRIPKEGVKIISIPGIEGDRYGFRVTGAAADKTGKILWSVIKMSAADAMLLLRNYQYGAESLISGGTASSKGVAATGTLAVAKAGDQVVKVLIPYDYKESDIEDTSRFSIALGAIGTGTPAFSTVPDLLADLEGQGSSTLWLGTTTAAVRSAEHLLAETNSKQTLTLCACSSILH